MSLERLDVVQGLLNLYHSPRYLEIGVSTGRTFLNVRASIKVAVDPVFRFDVDDARRAQPESQFWNVTSDEYFGRIVKPGMRFDVIFLDGLHTFEQTLRDLNNALLFLDERGVIIIDDVHPSSHLAAIPDLQRFARAHAALDAKSYDWMSDVYRLVFFIDSF